MAEICRAATLSNGVFYRYFDSKESLFKVIHDAPVRIGAVCELLCDGLFRGLRYDPAKVFGGSASPLPMPLDEGARERLLRSGRLSFDKNCYNIVREAEFVLPSAVPTGPDSFPAPSNQPGLPTRQRAPANRASQVTSHPVGRDFKIPLGKIPTIRTAFIKRCHILLQLTKCQHLQTVTTSSIYRLTQISSHAKFQSKPTVRFI